MAFRSSEDDVLSADFEDVLKVLGGPSRWHRYLSHNLDIVRRNLSAYTFTVERSEVFIDHAKNLLGMKNKALVDVQGVTDKKTGTILLKEHTFRSAAAYLLGAVHECVHLLEHPVHPHVLDHSFALLRLGFGLHEGIVEVITEDILNDQGIKKPVHDHMQGHEGPAQIARRLIWDFGSIEPLADLLFKGQPALYLAGMKYFYGDFNQWSKFSLPADKADDPKAQEQARQLLNSLRSWRAWQRSRSIKSFRSYATLPNLPFPRQF
jgi:hypothetical protein